MFFPLPTWNFGYQRMGSSNLAGVSSYTYSLFNMFGHEKLRAYPKSIEFVALTYAIVEKLPKGHGKLIDQLQRAAISVPLNIAEGSGKISESDKKRYYSIARGSAMECVAMLDVLYSLTLLDTQSRDLGRELLNEVVGILTVICNGKRQVPGR